MKIRKILSVAALSLLVGVVLPVTASAHGHGGHRRNASNKYTYCSVEDCTRTGNHKHNGKTYTAHHTGDGHRYH